jgi:hypothetical protein
MAFPERLPGLAKTLIERADDPHSAASSAPDSGQPSTPSGPPSFDNSALLDAMRAVAHHDSRKTRRHLYEAMLKTWFLAPVREVALPRPGFHTVPEGQPLPFSLEHDGEGMMVAVAFTDEEALRNWNATIPWIGLQGAAFFQALLATEAEEIVINPYEPENPASKMIRPGGRVTRQEFTALSQGVVPQPPSEASGPQSVLIAMPKDMPAAETLAALANQARNLPQVLGMFFGQVIYPQDGPHRTIAVDLAPDTSEQMIKSALAALAQEAQRIFAQGPTDFLDASTVLGQSIAKSGKKFYSAANRQAE